MKCNHYYKENVTLLYKFFGAAFIRKPQYSVYFSRIIIKSNIQISRRLEGYDLDISIIP